MSSYKHILCPTDFSACSDEACAHAAEVAGGSGAKLTLLHVVSYFPQDRSDEEIAPENEDPQEYRQKKAMAALQEQAARVDAAGAELAVTFTSHSDAYGIISYAATADVDLIVLGSHAHDWVERLFGSTVEYVQEKANCEVMLVPTGVSAG